MIQSKSIVIVQIALEKQGIQNLADIKTASQFLAVFGDSFERMNESIGEFTEDETSPETLEVIRDDLHKLTKTLVKLRRTEMGDKYPLDDLRLIVNHARKKIIEAIGIEQKSSPDRTEAIQGCWDKIIEAGDKIEEFANQRS